MSEIQIHTCFRENLCQKFSQLNVSSPQPDTQYSSPSEAAPPDTSHSVAGDVLFRNNVAFFNFEQQRLSLNQPDMWGDARPLTRFHHNPSASKSRQELLQSINEKMQKNASRREQFIQDIVLKNRKFIERVQEVRERLSKKELESAQNVQNLRRERRQAAEKVRQWALQTRLDRVKKRLDHTRLVKNRKLSNSSPDQSPETSKTKDTQSPTSFPSTINV